MLGRAWKSKLRVQAPSVGREEMKVEKTTRRPKEESNKDRHVLFVNKNRAIP